MNRPLALIKGNLTIPLPRPFDGLPPPFGARRRMMRKTGQKAANKVGRAARATPFPPGVKHVLFYKAPPQHVDTQRWDTAMAEAKRYLEMGPGRPRSSRLDHLLAAAIFAGCSIVLTWLLVTCSMKDAEKAKAVSVTPTLLAAANAHADRAQSVGKPTLVNTQGEHTDPEPVASAAPAMPKQVTPIVTRQMVQLSAAGRESAIAAKRVKVARLTKAHVNKHAGLNRAAHPVTRPVASTQPEWTDSASYKAGLASDVPWPNWGARQHRPVSGMGAATPVANNWNDHMTHRRITDEPAAFHTNRSEQ